MTRRSPETPIAPEETGYQALPKELAVESVLERMETGSEFEKSVERLNEQEKAWLAEARQAISEYMQELLKKGEISLPSWVREGFLAMSLLAPGTAAAQETAEETQAPVSIVESAAEPARAPESKAGPSERRQVRLDQRALEERLGEKIPDMPRATAKQLLELMDQGTTIEISIGGLNRKVHQEISRDQIEERRSLVCDWDCDIKFYSQISSEEAMRLVTDEWDTLFDEDGEMYMAYFETTDAYGNDVSVHLNSSDDGYTYAVFFRLPRTIQSESSVSLVPISVDLSSVGQGTIERIGYTAPLVELEDMGVPFCVSAADRLEMEPLLESYQQDIEDSLREATGLFGLEPSVVGGVYVVDYGSRNGMMNSSDPDPSQWEMNLGDELFKPTEKDPYSDASVALPPVLVRDVVFHETFHAIDNTLNLTDQPIFTDLQQIFFTRDHDPYEAFSEHENGMYGGHAEDDPAEALASVLNLITSPQFEQNITAMDSVEQRALFYQLVAMREVMETKTDVIPEDAPIFSLLGSRIEQVRPFVTVDTKLAEATLESIIVSSQRKL